MSTLIIKSKIWNNISNHQSINYKEKNFQRQKFTIEHSTIIYRKQDKIVLKQIDESNYTSNSNDRTNYMNEKKDELLTILKQPDNKYAINCGNWSKDLSKLIDENAAYILYKGLTIENLLKEKQKYYVLNQGDIIKIGKIYLKLLHINMFNSDKDDDNEGEKKEDNNNDNDNIINNNINSIKEEEEKQEEEEMEEEIKNNIEEENNKRKQKSKILLTYTNDNINKKKENKKTNKKFANSSFSYVPNNYKNLSLYINLNNKEQKKDRLNKSFNGKLSPSIANNIIKESININHSKSPKLSQIKALSVLNKLKKSNLSNKSNHKKKKITNIKAKLIHNKKIESKQNKKELEKKQIFGKICRICLSGETDSLNNPLICPCTCKGSMKYIHYLCLKNWLNLKVEAELDNRRNLLFDQPTITYSTKDISCELCKARLPDYIRHNGKIFNVLFYKPKYEKFIVLESIRDDERRTKFIHIIPLVRKSMLKIGRLNSCDLSLPDISISRVHCCLYIESGQIFLENNSKYGTKILVQNNNLIMSSTFPLCLEIQNTYLKLILKKNFSLFGCCGVSTTTISKMLVYQEQNEKGFDIFCSMIIKEDNDNDDKEDSKVEKKEENIKQSNRINNINSLNQGNEKSKVNLTDEEMIKKEIIDNIKIDSEIENKIINSDIGKEMFTSKKEENNSIKNKSKISINNKINENENNNEIGIINLNNSQKESHKKEIFTKIEKEKEPIKSIKISNEEINSKKSNLINRTFMADEYINNGSDRIPKTNIDNEEMNRTMKKYETSNLNDKILSKIQKEKFKNEEIKIINSGENKKGINTQIQNDETQRMNIKKEDNIILPSLLGDKEIAKNKGEIQKEEKKNEINEEKHNKEVVEKKDEEIKNLDLKNKQKIELNQKKMINKKFQEIDKNYSINLKETRYDKTISDQKDEASQNAIKLQSQEETIKQNHEYDNNEENKINDKQEKKIKKHFYKPMDLKAINELSYCHVQNSYNINYSYSPNDSYHSIFGLRQKENNEGSSLLAPKHKNINFQKLELNSNNDKNINVSKSNASWNKYTYQYEEDKKNKNKNG